MIETMTVVGTISMLLLFMSLMIKFKDSRGEVAPEDGDDQKPAGGEPSPPSDPPDDYDQFMDELNDLTLDLDGTGDSENDDEDLDESDDEGASAEGDDIEKPKTMEQRVFELEKSLQEKDQAVQNLTIALRKERQEAREQKTTTEEQPLTREQLKGLMEEHQDNPDVQLNILEYVAEQAAKKKGKEQIDMAQASAMKRQTDEALQRDFPDLAKEDSQLRMDVDTLSDRLMIPTDHPMKDLFAVSVMVMNKLADIRKAEYERGKKEALGEKADNKRKKSIQDQGLLSPGKQAPKKAGSQGSGGLTGSAAETAKQMGMTPAQQKIYARFLKQGV